MAAEPTVLPLDELPEEVQRAIGAVRAREASARDSAMFDMPAKCGPFTLRQMRPHDSLLLFALQNRIFMRGSVIDATPEDVFAFVHILARGIYRNKYLLGLRLACVLMFAKPRARLMKALQLYIFEALIDWPSGGSGPARGDTLRGSFLSHMFHLLASSYHWSEIQIAAIPVRRLLIYRKHIVASAMQEEGKRFIDMSAAELAIKDSYISQVNGDRN